MVVSGTGAGGGKFVHVDQHPIFAAQALAHIKDGLVLVAFAARVEVVLTTHLRSSDGANFKQLREAGIDLVASRERVKNGSRGAEFLFDVELGIGVVPVVQV